MTTRKRRGKLSGHTSGRQRKAVEEAARRLEEAQRRAASPRRVPSQKTADVAHRRAEALRLIHEEGLSYRQAAKRAGTGAERLRKYAKQLEVVEPSRPGRKVKLSEERYTQATRKMTTYSNGKIVEVSLSRTEAQANAHYLNAVHEAVSTKKPHVLDGFDGLGVTDMEGDYLPFETRYRVLKKLVGSGEGKKPVVYMVVKSKEGAK